MTSIYAQRRAALASQLGSGGVAIIPTAPERARNRDSDFPYRHDSYFYYLTGVAPICRPSVKATAAGPSHGSIIAAWYS